MKSSEGAPGNRQLPSFYEFGAFRLDPVKRTLWRGSEPVPLTGRAFDTLVALIQNRGQTVDKDTLIEMVWADAAVEENNLTQSISALRKALGETRGDHKYIVTLPGMGYRFVAEVAERFPETGVLAFPSAAPPDNATAADHGDVDSAPSIASTVRGVPELRAARRGILPLLYSWSRDWRLALALALFLAGALSAGYWLVMRPSVQRRTRNSSPQPARRTMLAVLPFNNLTGDASQVYFSDGLTEEIITQLGRRDPSRLGVIARTSVMRYKHSTESLRQIARDLGVAYVVEGSVRRSDGKVRISARLIRASDQTDVWAKSYERPLSNVLALEAEVARDVERAISRRLNEPRNFAGGSPRVIAREAHDAYLKGLYFFDRRDKVDLVKAVASFKEAIRRDPGYARAYAGLANSYTLLALYGASPDLTSAPAKAAALKSVALDDGLAETHTALAAALAVFGWDWPGAQHEFRRALRANPNDELAHHWYATFYLAPEGRGPDSVAEMKLAQQLDPVSLIANTDLGWAYFIAGRYQDAFRQYQKTLALDADFVPVHFRLAEYYLTRRMYANWASEIAQDYRLSGDAKTADTVEKAYRQAGYDGVFLARLAAGKVSGGQPFSAPLGKAHSYALLNRKDDAIRILGAMGDRRDPGLLYIKVDPAFAGLRSDPRFEAIERRMGLNP